MSDPYDFEPLIDVNEVARLFKFTPQHIRRLAERKIIPATKYGREWRFRRSDLNRSFHDACTGPKNIDVFSNLSATPPPVPSRPRGRPRND
jgi:excisionase family DNA binding protein